MAGTAKRAACAALAIMGAAALWLALNWSAEPRPTAADPPPDPPAPSISLLFVIDSSHNMFPWDGQDYFAMAKAGILEFLQKESFASSFVEDGTFEVGVIQYCKEGSPGYYPPVHASDLVHWFPPTHITTLGALEDVQDWVRNLEPCMHFTRTLMDVGIRHGRDLLAETAVALGGQKHMILLGTGEYRLPRPCPPACYNYDNDLPSPCEPTEENQCPTDELWCCEYDNYDIDCSAIHDAQENCSRVCQARYFAQLARDNVGITISSIHVGPDWRNSHCSSEPQADTNEAPHPYGDDPNYCSLPSGLDALYQPDRAGLLQELARTADADGQPCSGLAGKYARMRPAVCWGCGPSYKGDDEFDIAETIGDWVCNWLTGLPNSDTDDIPDICDNCPGVANPRQRDCNADGTGDLCQSDEACGGPKPHDDSDRDGLCDALDTCEGGDDCLIRYWASRDPAYKSCDVTADADLSDCGCNCEGTYDENSVNAEDRLNDLCRAARRHAELTLPSANHDFESDPDGRITFDEAEDPPDGIPDCAQYDDPLAFEPQCRPFPETCDLASEPPPSASSISFSDVEPSESAIDYLTKKNWRWSGVPGALVLNPTAPHMSGCSEGQGTLTINPAGQNAAVLTSPDFGVVVRTECARCGSSTSTNPIHMCTTAGPSTFVVLEMDVRLVGDIDEIARWHVVVEDGCGRPSPNDRAHIILEAEPNDAPKVFILQQPDSCTEAPSEEDPDSNTQLRVCKTSSAPSQTQWFTFRVVLNNGDVFRTSTNPPCSAVGHAPDQRSVRVFAKYSVPCLNCTTCGTTCMYCTTDYWLGNDGYYESSYREGDTLVPEPLRCLQVKIYPELGTSRSISIGTIHIARGDGCDFDDKVSPCASCRCLNVDTWSCSPSSNACQWPWPF